MIRHHLTVIQLQQVQLFFVSFKKNKEKERALQQRFLFLYSLINSSHEQIISAYYLHYFSFFQYLCLNCNRIKKSVTFLRLFRDHFIFLCIFHFHQIENYRNDSDMSYTQGKIDTLK